MPTLYGIPNCDTIKRTKIWLQEHAVEFQFHDYKKLGCSTDLVEQFLEHFSYQELINTRGSTWRKLPDSVKNSLNRTSAIELMHEQPSLIKRPLIQDRDEWLLGFDAQRLHQVFC